MKEQIEQLQKQVSERLRLLGDKVYSARSISTEFPNVSLVEVIKELEGSLLNAKMTALEVERIKAGKQ